MAYNIGKSTSSVAPNKRTHQQTNSKPYCNLTPSDHPFPQQIIQQAADATWFLLARAVRSEQRARLALTVGGPYAIICLLGRADVLVVASDWSESRGAFYCIVVDSFSIVQPRIEVKPSH